MKNVFEDLHMNQKLTVISTGVWIIQPKAIYKLSYNKSKKKIIAAGILLWEK